MSTARRTQGAVTVLLVAVGLVAVIRAWQQKAESAPAVAAAAPVTPVTPSTSTSTSNMPVVADDEPAAAPPEKAPTHAPPVPAPPLDETALMTLLRSASGNDPTLTVELAREGNRRFLDSPDAPERASALIHALAELGQSAEARGEAENMVNHYPDSRWVREIELFTGAHRHRKAELDAQGRLRFVDPPPT